MTQSRIHIVSAVALAILMSACTVGPDYKKPEIQPPPQFVSQDVLDILNEGKDAETFSDQWWMGFHDEILNRLVIAGIESNFEIAAATARAKQSMARIKLAGAGDNPVIDVDAGGDIEERQRLDGDEEASTSTSLSAGLGLLLPLDIFGRTRRDVEAARAEFEAAQEELKSIVLATTAEITSEYLSLRGNQRQLELLEESVKLQEKTLSIVRSRFESGLSPELDLQRAISSVESLRARVPPLQENLKNSRNRLATLSGEFPGAYENLLKPQTPIPVYNTRIPELIPLEVLNARPDIRQAEAALKSAIAEIGIAEAEYYPSFSLAGNINIGTSGISSAPGTTVLIASLAGLIEQVVTSGGARDANLAIAKAQAEEALANYEQILRDAVAEVETSLNAIQASALRQQSLEKSIQASERSFSQAQTLYQQGLISFLDVVDAQQDLADDEQALAAERTDYATEIATLFRVMGTNVSMPPAKPDTN